MNESLAHLGIFGLHTRLDRLHLGIAVASGILDTSGRVFAFCKGGDGVSEYDLVRK